MTIEFLFAFLPALAITGLLGASLAAQAAELDGHKEEFMRICEAESAARALEALYFSGIDSRLDIGRGGVRFSVEGGRLHSDYLGKVVEIRGVFSIDDSEPA